MNQYTIQIETYEMLPSGKQAFFYCLSIRKGAFFLSVPYFSDLIFQSNAFSNNSVSNNPVSNNTRSVLENTKHTIIE